MRKLSSLTILYCLLGSRVHTCKVKLRALSPDSADSRQLGQGVGTALARAAAGYGGLGLAGLTPAFPTAKARPPIESRA
jgi:hypothetical protein